MIGDEHTKEKLNAYLLAVLVRAQVRHVKRFSVDGNEITLVIDFDQDT